MFSLEDVQLKIVGWCNCSYMPRKEAILVRLRPSRIHIHATSSGLAWRADKSAVTRNWSWRQMLNYVMKIVLFFSIGVLSYIINCVFLLVSILIFGADIFIYSIYLFIYLFILLSSLLLLLLLVRLNSRVLLFGWDLVSTTCR